MLLSSQGYHRFNVEKVSQKFQNMFLHINIDVFPFNTIRNAEVIIIAT